MVTPETVKGFITWPASIALLVVASIAMIVATMSYLRVVHHWDPLSALMGASPGSMIQVIALSTELGADLRAIAIVQTMRVLLLTIGIPGGLALFGLVAPAMPVARGPAGLSSLPEMAIVVAVSTASALALMRGCDFPAGLFSAPWPDRASCTAPVWSPPCCRGGSAAPRSLCSARWSVRVSPVRARG